MNVYVVYTWTRDYYIDEDAANCEVYSTLKAARKRVKELKSEASKTYNAGDDEGIEIIRKELNPKRK